MNHVENICYECKMSENDSKMHNVLKTVDVTIENNVLPNREQNLKVNLISELPSSSNLKFDEKSSSKYLIPSRSRKELKISLESEKTCHEDAAGNINTEYSLNRKSRAFLSSLLSNKLNVLLAVEQSRKGLDERIKKYELHNAYRRQTKSETFKVNWNAACSSIGRNNAFLKERFSNRKTEAAVKEQAKSSGAVPKRKTFHNEYRYDDKKEGKFYRDTRPGNLSAKGHDRYLKDDTRNKPKSKELKPKQGSEAQAMKDDQLFNSKFVERGENKHNFSASQTYSNAFQEFDGRNWMKRSNTFKFKNSNAKDNVSRHLKYRPSDNRVLEEKHEMLSDQRDNKTDSEKLRKYRGSLIKRRY